MKRRRINFIKRHWALLWLIIALSLLASFITYAAYTKMNKAKNVVAKYGTVNSRFSSNYLEENGREKPVYVTSSDGKFGDTIFVGNYAQTNPTYHYDTVINYKLEMKLGYMNGTTFEYLTAGTSTDVFDIGTRSITATITGNNNYSKTIVFGYNGAEPILYEDTILKNSGGDYLLSLPGTTSVSDSISLIFSEDQKTSLFADEPQYSDKLYLEITATPDPLASYTGLSPLVGRICLAKSEKVESITWTGNFNESGSDTSIGTSPHTLTNQLDGYNYVIQGMGAGIARLRWKPEFLEVNEQFLIEELNIAVGNLPSASDGYKSVEFYVDSNNDKNRYDIQFYRSGEKNDDSYDTWEKLNSYVEFTFPVGP